MIEDLLEGAGGGWGLGVALVVGAGLLVARGGRPMAKGAVRGWLTVSTGVQELAGGTTDRVRGVATRATESVRGLTATVVEQAQDLYAESRAELASQSGSTRSNSARAKA